MFETPDGGIRLPRPYTGPKMGMGGRKHFTGSLIHGEDEGEVANVQSHIEMLTALVAIARYDVVRLENQIPFKWVAADGSSHTHKFDFRVTLRDGRRIALVVKHSSEAETLNFKVETECIASQVTSEVADKVRVVTEKDLDPVDVHNAELIYAVRLPDPPADAAARRAIQGLIGAAKIGDLVAETGHGGQGFRAVVRLLRTHELRLVGHERITYEALVCRRDS